MDGTIAALYAQTGYTARVVHDAATGPQSHVAMSQLVAEEMRKLEQGQVQEVTKIEDARVTDNTEHNKKEQQAGGQRHDPQDSPSPDADDPGEADSPLVGNLLNVKV